MRLKGILWRAGVNGCGVFGIKPPLWRKYQACCELHDALYDLGGDGKARFKADRKLLEGMLAKSDKARYVLWTVGYYYAVRAFGWLFFNYKDKKKDAKKY